MLSIIKVGTRVIAELNAMHGVNYAQRDCGKGGRAAEYERGGRVAWCDSYEEAS